MRVIIDGAVHDEHSAALSVFDWVVVRGFGAFEVIRSYGGYPFRLTRHLERLEGSAAAMQIPCPRRQDLQEGVERVAQANPDGQIRVILTGGGRDPLVTVPSRSIVMWEPLPPLPERVRVLPTVAPWHPATDRSGFPGVKWTSYAPNMIATDRARRAGFDDALLLSTGGIVLEGPTFTYAWVRAGVVETPSLDLGILPSVTREVVLECCARLGTAVAEGQFSLERVLSADEVLALSTVKQVTPVEQVGEHTVPGGPFAARLVAEFAAVVRAETGAPGSAAATP